MITIKHNASIDYERRVIISVIAHRKHFEIITGCGTSDDIYTFSDSESIYILSLNYGLPYAGLTIYRKSDLEPIGDVFLQEHNAQPYMHLVPINICKALSQYID